jgi:hypothetical protein
MYPALILCSNYFLPSHHEFLITVILVSLLHAANLNLMANPYRQPNPTCRMEFFFIHYQNIKLHTKHQPEDGCSIDQRNVGILPQQCTASQGEAGCSIDLRNVGILPQHMTSQGEVKMDATRTRCNKVSPWTLQMTLNYCTMWRRQRASLLKTWCCVSGSWIRKGRYPLTWRMNSRC